MRNVPLLLLVTLVTRTLANICSNNVAGRSMFVCQNATLDNLSEIPRYIYRIKFVGSNIRIVPSNGFVEFYELKSLSLINCSIENVESFAFAGLANLRILNLSRNALTVIRENAFSGLTSLKKLDLTNNMMKTIEEGSFPDSSNIGWLDLRHNNLTRINDALLRSLSSASTLDLRHNKLRCVSPGVFNGTRVKWIYIGDNPWDGKCWTDLTRSLYDRRIYYGRNLAFDTLKEDRLAWNSSDQEGRDLPSEEQAEEEVNVLREAEGWKEFYETIVQEIDEGHQRLDDIDITAKQSEEGLSNRHDTDEDEDEEEVVVVEEDTGLFQYGRKIVLWVLSMCRMFHFDFSSR